MPNLIDKSQRLTEPSALATLHEDRCLLERDLNATCSVCATVCPVEAIVLERSHEAASAAASYGSVSRQGPAGPCIDEEVCVQCGRCITACPTGALLPLAPHDDSALLETIARAGLAAAKPAGSMTDGGEGELEQAVLAAGFACERAIKTMRLDADRTVVLPCLGWLDEALLVHMACSGARHIVLLTALCPTCEHANALEDLSSIVERAQRMLDTWELDSSIELIASPSDDVGVVAASTTLAVGEVSRRGLLSQAGSSLLSAASEAATAQVRSLVGHKNINAEALPEPDRRRWQLLDDLHAVGLPDEATTIVPRSLAPRVSINANHCSGCALCAQFCPTSALRKVGKTAGGKTLLEFDATLCRDCGVCTDTCRYEALSCEETLTVAELFALEPQALVIPKRRVLPSRR